MKEKVDTSPQMIFKRMLWSKHDIQKVVGLNIMQKLYVCDFEAETLLTL